MDLGRIQEDSDNLLLDRAHQTFELRKQRIHEPDKGSWYLFPPSFFKVQDMVNVALGVLE